MSYFVAERARAINLTSVPGVVSSGHKRNGWMRYSNFIKLLNAESWKPEQRLWDESTSSHVMIDHVTFWLGGTTGDEFLMSRVILARIKSGVITLLDRGLCLNSELASSTKALLEKEGTTATVYTIPRVVGVIYGDDKNKRWERAAELVICDIIRKHIPVHPGLMKGV